MSVSLRFLRSGTSAIAVLGTALSFATIGSAVAQDQPAAAGAAPMEEIVVTGSRIRTSDVTSSAPLTVVSSEQIAKTEAVTVEQFLRKLPDVDFSGGITSNDNNGGLGASQVSMRNLGPARTLVLVNGLRFPYTDTQGSTAAVDLNNIPTAMIDHVEILRDGASSIYGADAIAGVINIITKKNYNGLDVQGSFGETSYGDGSRYNAAVTLGQNFANDRGNILINLDYNHISPIQARNRDWAIDEHADSGTAGYAYGAISSRVRGLKAEMPDGSEYYYYGGKNTGINLGGSPASIIKALGAHTSDGIGYTGGHLAPGDTYIPAYGGVFFNYLPTEYLQGSLDSKQANFTGHYDVTDSVTVVMDGFYTNRSSQQLLNPEPLGFNVFTPKFPEGMSVPLYYQKTPGGRFLRNPYFPVADFVASSGKVPTVAAVTANPSLNPSLPVLVRRFENGPRVYSDDIDTYRFHVGLEGTVFDDANWEAGYYYGRSNATYRVQNEANLQHLQQLSGAIPCGSDAFNGCSISNFFKTNGLTKAQAQYLVFNNTDTSQYGESVLYGNISGTIPYLPELPGGPIKGSIGFEYRTENGFDNPDSVTSAGNGATFSSPTSGGYTDASLYAEVKLPILKDLPFVKSLDVDASARYDYFNTFGRALTYKVGVNYAPVDDFRLRVNNSTGYRAPQIRELFGGQSVSAIGGANADPCAPGGAFENAPTCTVLNGIGLNGKGKNTLTQVNQISALIGGNPSVRPETSQQWSIGGVFTPSFVPNLTFTVDYYTILIRNEISSYSPTSLLNDCYGNVPYVISQAAACALITRQSTGNLGFVKAIDGNIADENTSGIDVTASYGFDAKDVAIPTEGHFQVTGSANYLLADDITGQGASFDNCNFLLGCVQQAGSYSSTSSGVNGGEPRWKALVQLDYSQDNWSASWTTRYYGGLKNANEGTYCLFGSVKCPNGGAGDFYGNEAAGIFYHDISFTYTYDNAAVTVGVDNLFDKDPPFVISGTGDVYLSDAGYDNTGRFVYMKFDVKFGAETAAPKEAAAYTPPAPAPVAPAVPHSYLVFFDFNKSDLTSQAKGIVDQAAANAGPAHVTQLTVTGHTDTVGSDAYNMRLSRRRAESVAAQLEKDGIASSEIEIVAKGKRDLLVPTADGVREPQNRRVQIVYSGGPTS